MAGYPMGYGSPYGMQPGYNQINYQAQPMNGYSYNPVQQQPAPAPMVQMPMATQQSMGQPMVLGGKPVDSLDVVKAIDIPMDNATYYFPKPDGSEIYTKRWAQDGSSEIVTYKREAQPPSEETKQFMDGFLCKDDVVKMHQDLSHQLGSILERVSKLEEAFK